MITIRSSFLSLPTLEIWWPDNAGSISALLEAAPILSIVQCSDAVAEAVRSYAFRERVFHTLLIDLSQPEEELYRQLHRHSCRHKIEQAAKMDFHILVNEAPDKALKLINGSIRRKRYGPPVSKKSWEEFRERSDVFLIEHDGQIVCAHVVLLDAATRARALMSATIPRDSVQVDRMIGLLNRFLHWSEIRYYKKLGFQYYDFGGISLGPTQSDLYSINLFKLSFGGCVVKENVIRLAARPVLRRFLRFASSMWDLLGNYDSRGTVVHRGPVCTR